MSERPWMECPYTSCQAQNRCVANGPKCPAAQPEPLEGTPTLTPVEALAVIQRNFDKATRGLLAENERLTAENERLREDALTPEEARKILNGDLWGVEFFDKVCRIAERPEPLEGTPTLERAIQDLREYATVFCRDVPERYEVSITAQNEETRLSESVLRVLSEVTRLTAERDKLREREREALDAHAASFGALAGVANIVGLEGVDDYAEVSGAVERLREDAERWRAAYEEYTANHPTPEPGR
jgi:Asp-tRNA(Asn)/Glu-tRNA(Gln) amidotransferase C subunit